VQDASLRRVPFQRKIGAGISQDEFYKSVQAGTIKHVGLPESVHYIAHVLGLDIDSVQEDIQPVMDDATVQGVQQQARGMQGKRTRIELNFIASMNNPNPQDTIIIQGKPNCELRIAPEVNGDTATTAVTVNAIASVLQARPGLQTMASIPPVHYWS
jgi:2,4-diaminopentanoate dehydrogenase